MANSYRNIVAFSAWLDDTKMGGGGLHLFEQDEQTGKLAPLGHYAGHLAAGYFCVSPDARFLYVINELKHRPDYSEVGGSVHAFEIKQGGGTLQYLGGVPSAGIFPCYLAMDSRGRALLVPNYGSEGDDFTTRVARQADGTYKLVQYYDEPSMAVVGIGPNGGLEPVRDLYPLEGKPSGISKWLQSISHPHSVNIAPGDGFALVTDRGCDRLVMYAFDAEKRTLEIADILQVEPGIGPRNSVFHPSLPYVFVLCEVMPRLGAYAYDRQSGKLNQVCLLSTIPEEEGVPVEEMPQDLAGFLQFTHPSDIQLHPNGHFLYVTNRGNTEAKNTVAVFAINQLDGSLSPVEYVPSKGMFCRICGFDVTGKYLYVGNQQTGNIETFRADPDTGRLTNLDQSVQVPRAVCVKSFRVPL